MAEPEQLGLVAQLQEDCDLVFDPFSPPKELSVKYQATFNTPMGRDVLADIVSHAFEVLHDENDMHQHNNAIMILVKLGLIKRGPEGVLNARDIVTALFTLRG